MKANLTARKMKVAEKNMVNSKNKSRNEYTNNINCKWVQLTMMMNKQ
jgi:hypothetical protein